MVHFESVLVVSVLCEILTIGLGHIISTTDDQLSVVRATDSNKSQTNGKYWKYLYFSQVQLMLWNA